MQKCRFSHNFKTFKIFFELFTVVQNHSVLLPVNSLEFNLKLFEVIKMSSPDKLIGIRIMQQRKSLGLSQEKLAEKLGISKNHLSNIERGKYIPTTEFIFKICNTMGNTPDYYLIGTPTAETDEIVNLIKTLPAAGQDKLLALIKFYINNLL